MLYFALDKLMHMRITTSAVVDVLVSINKGCSRKCPQGGVGGSFFGTPHPPGHPFSRRPPYPGHVFLKMPP